MRCLVEYWVRRPADITVKKGADVEFHCKVVDQSASYTWIFLSRAHTAQHLPSYGSTHTVQVIRLVAAMFFDKPLF